MQSSEVIKKGLLTEEQLAVAEEVVLLLDEPGYGEILIEGPAGCGKTVVAAYIYQKTQKDIVACAPTHKAVNVFSLAMGGIDAFTFHHVLGFSMDSSSEFKRLVPGRPNCPFGKKGLILDEASMVDPLGYRSLQEFGRNRRIKMLLLGDFAQLSPIPTKRGKNVIAEVSPVFGITKKFSLQRVMRHEGKILDVAGAIREMQEKNFPFKDELFFKGHLPYLNSAEDFRRNFLDLRDKYGDDTRILAWKNNKVDRLNKVCRSIVLGRDVAEKNQFVEGEKVISISEVVENKKIYMYKDEEAVVLSSKPYKKKVYVFEDGCRGEHGEVECLLVKLKNISRGGWVFNAVVPTAVGWKQLEEIEGKLDKWAKSSRTEKARRERWVQKHMIMDSFAKIKTCYAMTFHRSQGSSFEAVTIDLDTLATNHDPMQVLRILYVGLTRARKEVFLLPGKVI